MFLVFYTTQAIYVGASLHGYSFVSRVDHHFALTAFLMFVILKTARSITRYRKVFLMSSEDHPYNYVPAGFRLVLDEALRQVPQAREALEARRVPKAEEALVKAGFSVVAAELNLHMPYKYSV